LNTITQEEFQVLLPLACEWAEAQEQLIIDKGVALTDARIEDAKRVGVSHPKNVRLLKVLKIPMPDHPALEAAAQVTQLISPHTTGLTLRYGIFIRSDFWGNRRLIVHELVHTSQYERLGGFLPFLQRYLMECITIGYPDTPMEHEAVKIADEICH
jgi:hypothetical protein